MLKSYGAGDTSEPEESSLDPDEAVRPREGWAAALHWAAEVPVKRSFRGASPIPPASALPVLSSIRSAMIRLPLTRRRPTAIGRVKRRGPALPGLTNSTPSFSRCWGLWEWPEITAQKPRRRGVEVELGDIVKDEDEGSTGLQHLGFGQRRRPWPPVAIAAHRRDRREPRQRAQDCGSPTSPA